MTQQECIDAIWDVVFKTNPNAATLDVESMDGAVLSFMAGNPTVFKAMPQGATNFTCYWDAIFYYAQALVICEAITDPQLKKQCKINARESYCDSYDACGEA